MIPKRVEICEKKAQTRAELALLRFIIFMQIYNILTEITRKPWDFYILIYTFILTHFLYVA